MIMRKVARRGPAVSQLLALGRAIRGIDATGRWCMNPAAESPRVWESLDLLWAGATLKGCNRESILRTRRSTTSRIGPPTIGRSSAAATSPYGCHRRRSPPGSPPGICTRGGQQQYSDVAIETALTLRLLFHLPLRQAEGFLQSLFRMMGLELAAPDHTTLSRRGQRLDVSLRGVPTGTGLHLIVDSSGLSIVGEGEWATAKHGRRGSRGWKKLHLGVDRSGMIVVHALTDATVDDATTAVALIHAVARRVTSVTGDAAYDTIAVYAAARTRGATVIVPPIRSACVSRRGPRSRARDRTITRMQKVGRRRWKRETGYYQQARVENTCFQYKSIIGGSLRARSPGGQAAEALLACNILNLLIERGRPESYRIGR